MSHFQITIIGSGPGGYVAAIRASQLGFKTALIEKYNSLGGTCLNVGCIPSKALLQSSEHYHKLKSLERHGISINKAAVDIKKMMDRKTQVVQETSKGIEYLMQKNKITVLHGEASFLDKKTIQIDHQGDKKEITSDKIIIATGSRPFVPQNLSIDKERILTSTEALNLKEIPKNLIIIGGGIIAVELGSVFARLGSKVTLFEWKNRIIPSMDEDLSKELSRILKNDYDMQIYPQSQVLEVNRSGKQVLVKIKDDLENVKEYKGDYVFIVVGRKAYTKGLGLDKIGVNLNDRGEIIVDKNLETSVKDIYAIGDVIGGAMLAHKASDEAIFLIEHLAGQMPHIHYNLIPSVIYTAPELASVGESEMELKEKGIPYNKGQFHFRASGRARAADETEGFVKVLAHKETDEILGIHIIGHMAGELISNAVTAMEYRASAEDIVRISFAHPTFSEAFKEACFIATGNRPIHN